MTRKALALLKYQQAFLSSDSTQALSLEPKAREHCSLISNDTFTAKIYYALAV